MMKEIISIFMLAIAILIGGGVADAKTTTKKKSSTTKTAKKSTSFSVKGHTYAFEISEGPLTFTMKAYFRSNGQGRMSIYTNYSYGEYTGNDMTWTQNGNKVYVDEITAKGGSHSVFTISNGGKSLIMENGVVGTLIE